MASKVDDSPLCTLLVNASMVALLPSTLWTVFLAALTIPQLVRPKVLARKRSGDQTCCPVMGVEDAGSVGALCHGRLQVGGRGRGWEDPQLEATTSDRVQRGIGESDHRRKGGQSSNPLVGPGPGSDCRSMAAADLRTF